METCQGAVRLPPRFGRTAIAGDEPRGVVIVDVDDLHTSMQIGLWLQGKGHRPFLGRWKGPAVESLQAPVVGVVTDQVDDLEAIETRFSGALRVALVKPGETAPGADFTFERPFRPDLLVSRRAV